MTRLERMLTERLGPDWRRSLLRWAGAVVVLLVVAAVLADPVVATERVTGRLEAERYAQDDEGARRIWMVRTGADALRRVTPRADWRFEAGAEICVLVGRTAILRTVRVQAISLGACGEGPRAVVRRATVGDSV